MTEYRVKVLDGRTEWYQNGNLHREDAPAIEYADGSKEWYRNGEQHREDGPAVECANGYKSWWLNGEQFTEAEFRRRVDSYDGKEVEIDGKVYVLKLK